MSDDADKITKDTLRQVLYIGNDTSYWSNLKKRFQSRYPTLKFNFKTCYSEDQIEVQKLYTKILEEDQHIIYIDFSSNFPTQLFLSQFLTRETSLKDNPIVGLIGDKSEVLRCYSAGVDFIHIKSIEFFDVIYDPSEMIFPDDTKPGVFAKAKFKRDCSLYSDMRCAYATPTHIHVESHVKLPLNEVVQIQSEIDKKIMPSKKYLVKEMYDSDIYYNFNYAFDLEYMFVDEPSVNEEENEDILGDMDDKTKMKLIKKARLKRREKMEEYEEELKRSKQKVDAWVMDNLSETGSKKIKLLVVEKSMSALKHTRVNIDKLEYTLRFLTELSEDTEEISIFRPHIFVYQFPTNDEILEEAIAQEEELEWLRGDIHEFDEDQREKHDDIIRDAIYDSYAMLEEVIKTIKQHDSFSPFIILYNCLKYSSKSFQEKYSYNYVITNKASMNVQTVMQMAKIYEEKATREETEKIQGQIQALRKKDPKKYARLTTFDLKEKKYFINKTNKLSFVAAQFDITLASMNESEITFISNDEFPMWKTFRIDFPIELSVTTVPITKEANVTDENGKYLHRALVHSAGEGDKKHIRQFVNMIFFSALIEERNKELEQFKELNEKVQKERESASKELQEAVESVQDVEIEADSDETKRILEEQANELKAEKEREEQDLKEAKGKGQ